MAGGDARGDRDAERAAELLGGVDQPDATPGFVFGDAGERGDRYRDEGKGASRSTATRNGADRSPVVPVHGHLGSSRGCRRR